MNERRHRVRGLREAVAFAAVCLVTLAAVTCIGAVILLRPGADMLGVTFSSSYAQDLNLNPEEVLTALVSDLGARRVRIPVYWSDQETAPGVYDFSALDSLMQIANAHNVAVTLAIGMKVPRWPECYLPSFVNGMNESELNAAVYRYDQALISHAKAYPALARWQVENEPLFPYGDCPTPSLERLTHEVSLVRGLDPVHPVMLTVSGEQEPWLDLSSIADTIGVSMYRFAYNDALGAVAFPYSPLYYRVHAIITKLFAKDVVISELQMEPWFTDDPQKPESMVVPFTAADFVDHMDFAKRTGIHEVLLWGAEWWYYQKVHGDPSLWNIAKQVFSESK